jgi:hypothetical protein
MAYEVSSLHISGFLAAATELGFLEKAKPLLTAQSQHIVEHVFEQKWVSALVIQDLTTCVAKAYGDASIEQINFLMTKKSLGKLVLPMMKVALAITGSTPATVFSRLGESLNVAIRGIETTWAPSGAHGGKVTLRYPIVPPSVVHQAWFGVFRFGFELTNHVGRVASYRYLDGGKTIEFEVRWDA